MAMLRVPVEITTAAVVVPAARAMKAGSTNMWHVSCGWSGAVHANPVLGFETRDCQVRLTVAADGCDTPQGNDVVFLMGGDFSHSIAHTWFHNLDKLIHYVNQDGRVNAFYSTASQYVAAKTLHTNVTWPLKSDDFFPYSGNKHGTDYWTGYFTNRPLLKGLVRFGAALLHATQQVEVAANLEPSNQEMATTRGLPRGHSRIKGTHIPATAQLHDRLAASNDTAVLEFALAVIHHHDGITGNCQGWVG